MTIAQQLRNVFFKPITALSGSRRLGELGIFLASAGLHMIPVVTFGGSPEQIISTGAFFVVQPLLIMIEKSLGIKSKLWVQSSLWSVAPLFSLPLFDTMG